MYRQGDVLLIPLEAGLPADTTPVGHGVVAEGEATGHAHRLSDRAQLLQDPSGARYVVIAGEKGELAHEEHRTIILPGPAVYLVRIQRQLQGGVASRRFAGCD